MPIYQYKCKNCGFVWQKFYKIIPKEEDKTCPKCKSNNTYKLFNGINFKLDYTFSETGNQLTKREMQKNQDEIKFQEDEIKKKEK